MILELDLYDEDDHVLACIETDTDGDEPEGDPVLTDATTGEPLPERWRQYLDPDDLRVAVYQALEYQREVVRDEEKRRQAAVLLNSRRALMRGL